LAGFTRSVPRSNSLALLLDLRWNRFQPGSGPTPWQLDAVLRQLAAQTPDLEGVKVVARRGPEMDPPIAARRHHLAAVLEARGLSLEEIPGRTTRRAPQQRLPELEQWHGGGVEVPESTADQALVVLGGLSTHVGFGLAGAVGAVGSQFLELDLLREDPRGARLLAEALAFAREVHPSIFAVLDATTCGLGPGPRRVRPSNQNLLLASPDPVAADAVAARILGLDPRRVPYLVACEDMGLGTIALDEIEFVGEMPSTLEQSLHAPPSLSFSDRLALLGGRRALATPRRRARAILRDRIWYPFTGRRWRRLWSPTPWGRLFDDYAQRRTRS
jgi:hypothetical protein